jgi:Rab GDP dissociation inhibitor
MAMTMRQLFTEFGLEAGTQDFLGHSLALHADESYLDKPALETCMRIKLYMVSMLRFGKSPYVYPLYGLSELPQAFARLSAIYGATYMLDTPADEILFNPDNGKIKGIRSGEQIVTADAIICDPSYAPSGKTRIVHKVIRAICLLDRPIPSTNNSDSCQIIIPQRQLNRKYDVYIACVSSAHNVCADGYYVAMVSTIIETNDPEKEIDYALSLLGNIREKFIWQTEMVEPLEDGKRDHLYVARSYDASSHFETVCDDVKSLYERYAGKPLEIKKRPTAEEEQAKMTAHYGGVNEV